MAQRSLSKRNRVLISVVSLVLLVLVLLAPFFANWTDMNLGLATLVVLSLIMWAFLVLFGLAYLIIPKKYRDAILAKLRAMLDFFLAK
jgi:hypothetical protein